jgi:hypothetical protein
MEAQGVYMLRLRYFLDNQLRDDDKIGALRAGRVLPRRKVPGTHFCQRLC